MYNVHRVLTKRVGVKWRKMWKRNETQRKQKWVFQLGLHRANELLIWERYTSNILQYLRWLLKHILAPEYLCFWVYFQKREAVRTQEPCWCRIDCIVSKNRRAVAKTRCLFFCDSPDAESMGFECAPCKTAFPHTPLLLLRDYLRIAK